MEEDETQVEDVAEPSIVSSARGGKPRRGGTAFKVGRGGSGMATRRGRGRGGITLMQRLGLAANSPSASSYNDEGEEFSTSPPTSVPSIPINLHQASPPRTEEEEEENFFNSSTSSHTLQQDGMQSNRTSVASVDGMDPAFANVLKRSSSSSSYSSPLRHSLLSRRGSTRRKGVTTKGVIAVVFLSKKLDLLRSSMITLLLLLRNWDCHRVVKVRQLQRTERILRR